MFSKTIVESDAFLEMPLSSQCLYFHLSMHADDDGFMNSPKKVQRIIGASEDDLKILIAKRFIIPFESGVVVVKHWKINNYLRSDRYKETVYKDEKSLLFLKENNAYTLAGNGGIPLGIPTVDQRYTQYSIGKDSIDQNSVVEVEETPATEPNTILPLYPSGTYVVQPELVTRLKKTFPDVDIEYQLGVIRQVMESNPAKRRTESKIEQFLLNWMKYEHEHALQRESEAKAKADAGKKANDFHNFKQHDYDFDLIERALDNYPYLTREN